VSATATGDNSAEVDEVLKRLKDAYGTLEVITEDTQRTWFKWLEAECYNTGRKIVSRHHSPNFNHYVSPDKPRKLHMQHKQSYSPPQRLWCNLVSTLTRIQAYSTSSRMLVVGALQFLSEAIVHGYKPREITAAMHYMAAKPSSPFRLQWRAIADYLGKLLSPSYRRD
jgi:hypothetical protein